MITHFRLSLTFGESSHVMTKSHTCGESFSFSAIQSAAHFLCQLFQIDAGESSFSEHNLVIVTPFPQKDFDQHSSYVAWNILLNQCVLDGRAVRQDGTLYFDLLLDKQLKEALTSEQWIGFIDKTVRSEGDRRLEQLFGLDVIRRPQKKVVILSNTVWSIDRYKYLDAANFMGQLYNNEQWLYYQITELPLEGIPIQEDMIGWDTVILPGSPRSVYQNHKNVNVMMARLKAAYERSKLRILAICFGHQLVGYHFGAGVQKRNSCRFVEKVRLRKEIVEQHSFLQDLQEHSQNGIHVSQNHDDHVLDIPQGFDLLGSSASCEVEGFVSKNGRVLTTQFHPDYLHNTYLEKKRSQWQAHEGQIRSKLVREWQDLKRQHIKDSLLVRSCLQKFLSA